MNEAPRKNNKKVIIGVIIATILLLAASITLYLYNRPGGVGGNEATITGKVVCLPKKGDGPHTLECAFGIQSASDGKYYSLQGLTGDTANDAFNKTVSVTGIMKEPEANTSYDIAGSIEVKSFVVGQ